MRHLVAAAVGLVALPLLYYLTDLGARQLRVAYSTFGSSVAGLACLAAVAAVAAALVAWPGLSPLAALVCGLPLAIAGVLFPAELESVLRFAVRLPPIEQETLAGEPPGTLAGVTGLYVLVGGVLVLSALFPHRWLSLRGERTGS
ncbi:hypothetical protein ACIBG8_10360 [Nonomuraea sp. NPDC050556]|uniref:hypothetical protein n=1 Tax=Nonomuraea sp. NPDC050556 TaxID=3364369 RepID=UPI0037A07A83